MNKSYCSIGLMSGTSGDGVDASIITTDGENQYEVIIDRYFEYNREIYENIHNLKDKIANSVEKLKKFSKELRLLEEKITLFHADVVKDLLKETNKKIDFIGFHGQTILHSPSYRVTKQLGNGKLLSKLTKKNVVYNFRKNDLINDGQGAPLAPIFHKLIVEIKKIKLPITILNLGGIANITSISSKNNFSSSDIGPGNCLIDMWIRNNSKLFYDKDGNLAQTGEINKKILHNSLENFYKSKINEKKSFDIKDFDISFFKELSLENGAATITEFTAEICAKKIKNNNIYVCGGGRKNKFLIKSIEKKIKNKIKLIDELDLDGDFIESQAFGYLAIRSYLKLPISFPETTGCKMPCTGGEVVKSF